MLISQFGNATLRVGGTQQDYDVYVDFDDGSLNQTCENLPDVMTTFRCEPVYKEQWKELLAFSNRNGLKLVFGLNDMFGRPTKTLKPEIGTCSEKSCPKRNASNLKSLLDFTFQEKPIGWDSIEAFELGNELNKALNGTVGAISQAEDLKNLRTMVASSLVKIYGPDTHSYSQYSESGREWIEAFSKNVSSSIDAYTFHQYCMVRHLILLCVGLHTHLHPHTHTQGDGPSLDPNRLNASFLNLTALKKCREGAEYVINSTRPEQHHVIAGETAAANNGGQSGITDTYIDGFWLLFQLGEFAKLGIKQHFRQVFLASGGYPLVEVTKKKSSFTSDAFYETRFRKHIRRTSSRNVSLALSAARTFSLSLCLFFEFQPYPSL